MTGRQPNISGFLPQNKKDISELYGFPAADSSEIARRHRRQDRCPFLQSRCTKVDRRNRPTGVCTVFNAGIGETIICPNRFYFDGYAVLQHVASDAFGLSGSILHPSQFRAHETKSAIVALGHRFGKEVRIALPGRAKRRRQFYTDWVLARIGDTCALAEFVGVEVQSIDTTGNYRACRRAYMAERLKVPASQHGLNWENVNKRILPQIIFKANVLQREELCQKGLYVILPETVYHRILERLGGELEEYPAGRGAVTFLRYALKAEANSGRVREVEGIAVSRTAVGRIAERFTTARDLPTPRLFEREIRRTLGLAEN